jgi:hypothetical protein
MTVLRRQTVTEGQLFSVPTESSAIVRQAFTETAIQLGIRFGGLTEPRFGRFRVDNIIGTVVAGSTEIEVTPKCGANDDWIGAVLALLSNEKVALAGERAGEAGRRYTLIEAFALSYVDRLTAVIAVEGPITLIKRHDVTGSSLRGRLDVAKWITKASWQPHIFPSVVQDLSFENEFNDALSYVALLLSWATRSQLVRARLMDVAAMLSPGRPTPVTVASGIEERNLPEQWSAYEPAWSLARMVLKQQSPLSERRNITGMSLAIEPWPLLERLLERSLANLVRRADPGGAVLRTGRQTQVKFLDPIGAHASQFLVPDATLERDGVVVANFEAKYRDYAQTGRPKRSECYQAITAARSLSSPLAVLVYPGQLATRLWAVQRAGQHPERLAVVGLDLFSYRKGQGDIQRAEMLSHLIGGAGEAPPIEDLMEEIA